MGYAAMPTFTGHAVSIPGTVAGWADLITRHGRMALADVLAPTIRLADEGYPVSELIAGAGARRRINFCARLRGPRLISHTAPSSPAAMNC